MKKKDIPQDENTALENFTTDVYYVKNKENKYEAATSKGWDIKADALSMAWDDINEQTTVANQAVKNGEKSPVYYFMVKNIMDLGILSAYTGFWKVTIKRHFKPSVFEKLSDDKLLKYAKAFKISLDELKNFKPK